MPTTSKPYLSEELAELHLDGLTAGFWEACRRRQLAIQCCSNCGTFRHPPAPVCHVCRSFEYEWVPVSGKGSVFSYTVIYHAAHPALVANVPYNVVLVELPDAGKVRLISNLIETPPEEVQVGLPVEVTWEEPIPGTVLPRFRRSPRQQP